MGSSREEETNQNDIQIGSPNPNQIPKLDQPMTCTFARTKALNTSPTDARSNVELKNLGFSRRNVRSPREDLKIHLFESEARQIKQEYIH